MGRKTLLFLSTAHCQAYAWQDGKLSEKEYFTDDPAGREQFTGFLGLHPTPVYLLTDLVEEDFRHETIPHLHGGERAELIQRKLELYYRNTPFRQAITLQRSKDGRRDDDMLFSALTNPALLTPWLDIMLARSAALVGIYSIPNISAALIKDIPSDHLLLLSWEKHAGLRQTYFDQAQLRFSRLTPVGDSNSFTATAATESTRTQQYLKNLSLLPPGQALDVSIICHANDKAELQAHLNDSGDARYSYLDIQQLGRRIGSNAIYPDSDATPLFMHLLATQPQRNNYAAPEHTHFLKLLQLRRTLSGLSAAVAVASLLWSAANIREYMERQDGVKTLNAQSLRMSQQTRQITRSFPDIKASPTDMKTAVILTRDLGRIFPPPPIILNGLAQTLDEFPTIHIDKLSWQTGSGETGEAASAVPRVNMPQPAPAQIILLDGKLAELTGSYRGALNTMERFRQALTRRGYTVTALALPLDVSPQGSISTDTCGGSDKPAAFSLRISWRMAT